MKQIFQQYASYNLFANERLVNVVLSLSEADQKKQVESSFPSLESTLLHMWDAEAIWYQRVKLQEQVILPSSTTGLSTSDIGKGLVGQSKLWQEFVSNLAPAAFEHVMAYYSTKREYFKNEMWKTMLQAFNHSTYHRGQIVNIFHQLGVQKIPNTDYIAWNRVNTRLSL